LISVAWNMRMRGRRVSEMSRLDDCVGRLSTLGLCFLLLTALTAGATAIEPLDGAEQYWKALEPGLELGTFPAPKPADEEDGLIRVLRIDPARFALRLLNTSSQTNGKPHTPKEWATEHRLVAVINASMYQQDGRTSVSLMKTRGHTNHARLSKDNTILAFDRLVETVPRVQIIDRTCQDFETLQEQYGTLVQSIRMVSCRGNNVWSPQPHRWSTAAIGMDRQGRTLLIHVRSPYTTHDLADMLLSLPIDLKNAMYVEGGRQAQLYISSGGQEFEFVGSYDAGIVSGGFGQGWPVPNVIGVTRTAD